MVKPSRHLSSTLSTKPIGDGSTHERTVKATCVDCQRVVLVFVVDGKKLLFDIEVVQFRPQGSHRLIAGHRTHTESCLRYQREDRREDMRKEQRKGTRTRGL